CDRVPRQTVPGSGPARRDPTGPGAKPLRAASADGAGRDPPTLRIAHAPRAAGDGGGRSGSSQQEDRGRARDQRGDDQTPPRPGDAEDGGRFARRAGPDRRASGDHGIEFLVRYGSLRAAPRRSRPAVLFASAAALVVAALAGVLVTAPYLPYPFLFL